MIAGLIAREAASSSASRAARRRASPRGFRDITTAVDPALRLHCVQSAREAHRNAQQVTRFMALAIGIARACCCSPWPAGIEAMMSFAVVRRRREIGIRVALGTDARRGLAGIFTRATVQLGIGIAACLILSAALDRAAGSDVMGSGQAAILRPAVAALILTIGLAAAFGPARRALAVQPTEALREE